MNYKQDIINLFLYELQQLSKIKGINQKQVYLQLINYKVPENDQKQDLTILISEVLSKYKNKIEINELSYMYNIKNKKAIKTEEKEIYNIKIHIPIIKNSIENSIVKIINFLLKNKINFNIKISKIHRADTLVIIVKNKKEAEEIIKFININKDISDNLYEIIPLYQNNGKVFLTMDSYLTYNEILSKYICKYIELCNENDRKASFEDFKQYIYTNTIKFLKKDDLSEQISMINNKKNIQKSLTAIEEITTLLYLNLQDIKDNKNPIETFYGQYENLNSKEYNERIKDKYKEFTKENFEKDAQLLKELVITMSYKYGYDYAKQALFNYKVSGKINYHKEKETDEIMHRNTDEHDYITREKGLREKIKKSKTFKTYINLYNEEKLEKEVEKLKPELDEEEQEKVKTTKEMILENICKETYLSCQNKERNYCGNKQVAIALIRMQDNDYSCVTRNNNARIIAEKEIKPEEVVNLMKKSLETTGYIFEKEEDLYEIYALHIECLCEKN